MLLLRALQHQSWSFDLTILLSMENVYLPLTKSDTENFTFWGCSICLFPSTLCGALLSEGCQDELVEQTLVGCRDILVKFLPVSKVSEGITFDFVIQKSWIPMGSEILSGGLGQKLYLSIFYIIWF